MPIYYPQPQPQQITRHVVQDGTVPPPPADDPPFSRRALVGLAAVLLAWQPTILPVQAARYAPIPTVAVTADDPPPSARFRVRMALICSTWLPDPAPTQAKPRLVPPTVVAQVDNPPFAARRMPRVLVPIRLSWEPGPPLFLFLPPNGEKRPQGGTWVAPEIITADQFATYDLDLFTTPYEGRLLNSADLGVTRELADPLWNATPEERVTLELDNTDGALTAAYAAGLGARPVRLSRYDVRSATLVQKFLGTITWPKLGEHTLSLDCAAIDGALFTELIPEPVVETNIFPNAPDVGAVIPVVFGNVPSSPCPNVNDDKINSLFDYLIGHGVLAVTALARNGLNDSLYSIGFGECVRAAGGAATSWAEVARTDLYPGYTVVRFILRQQDFNNALHRIFADVSNPDGSRIFARAVDRLCSDATWGLGQPVDLDSIAAASRALAVADDAYRAAVLADGPPTVFYELEETFGTAAASVTGYYGAYTFGPTLGVGGPPVRQTARAVSFTGGQYVVMNVATSGAGDALTVLNNTNVGTIEAWYKPDALSTPLSGIADKTIGGVTNTQFFLFQHSDGQIYWRVVTAGPTLNDLAFQLTEADVGRWLHIVGTYNTGTMRLYANGVLVGARTYAAPILTGAGEFYIGRGCAGDISRVAFFQSELSAARVAAHFVAGQSLRCDGAMLQTKPAQDWLTDLLMVRGMRLGTTGDEVITLTVDQPRNTVAMAIGADPGDGPRNVVRVGERSGPSPEERVSTVVLEYRLDYVREEWIARARRTVNPTGKKRLIQHAFIRDATTADMVADYLGKRILFGQETFDVTVTQEGRALEVGDLVSVTKASQGLVDVVMEVWKIDERLTSLALLLRGYDWSTYAYRPAALAGDPVAGTESDFSRTVPSAGALSILNNSTIIAHDGHVTARVRYGITLPTTNILNAKLMYRIAGVVDWSIGAVLDPGATAGRIEGLNPGTSYDFGLQVVNAYGLVSTVTTDLARTTATDASVPSAVSTVAVRQVGARVVEIIAFVTVPSDWGTIHLYRATSNSFGAAAEIQHGKKMAFHDEDVAYGTTYYYWLKVEDQSGNLSSVSPSAGHSVTIVQIQTPDIGTGQVTTPTIANNAVSNLVTHVGSGGASTTSSTEADISGESVTITVTSGASPILVTWNATLNIFNLSGVLADCWVILKLYRGATLLYTADAQALLNDPSGRVNIPISMAGIDTGVSGSQTYKVRWSTGAFDGTFSAQASLSSGSILQAIELKR